MPGDLPRPDVSVRRWVLEKFDGDPPKPGENKLPVEVIEGGDGLPTVVKRRDSSGNLVPIGKE